MILGIMSDSHGDCLAIKQAVDVAGPVDLWLHAGDFCTDAQYLAEYSKTKVISVIGNCDGISGKSKVDEFFEVEGKKIWLTHGHNVKVKFGLEELVYWAKQYEVDLVIYGHTHIADISKYDNLLVLNPGTIGCPRYTKASFLKVKIENSNIMPELIEIS